MHTRLHPLVIAVVAALAGLNVPQLQAADYTGPLVIPDSSIGNEFTLGAGERFSYNGTATAIRVDQGGSFVSEGGILEHTGTGGTLLYLLGGKAHLDGGSVEYAGSSGRAVYVTGQSASLTMQNLDLNLSNASGSSPVEGVRVGGGATVVLDKVNINASRRYSRGLEIYDSNTNFTFSNGRVHTQAGPALAMTGAAVIEMSDTDLVTERGSAANLKRGSATFQNVNFTATGDNLVAMDVGDNAKVTLTGGVVDASAASSAIRILGSGNSTQVRLSGTKVYLGEGSTGYAININEKAQVFLDDVDIESGRLGVRMITPDSEATIDKSRITAAYMGVDATNGVATITDSSVTTTASSGPSARAYGLYVHRLQVGSGIGKESKLTVSNTAVLTKGDGAHGAYSAVGGEIFLNGGSVTTEGNSSYGVVVQNTGRVSLNGTVLRTIGKDSAGVVSAINTQALHHETEISNGASIVTQNAPAIVLMGSGGGSNTLTVRDSQIQGWTNQAENSGVLLQSQLMQAGGQLGSIAFNATNSELIGDVLISTGSAKLNLGEGTQLTGTIQSIGDGEVQQLVLADAATVWNVRGNSWLNALQQGQGQVAFVSPTSTGGTFHSVKVNNFYGGGLIVMNTVLAGDDAATNKLQIDGGAVTGETAMKITNAGGQGAQTDVGITVIQALNNASIPTANAFYLAPSSSGYRADSNTLFVGGYDYGLMHDEGRGWYLSSVYTGEEPEPEPDPKPDPEGGKTANISPEVGGYLGNRMATTQLFVHSLRDRASAMQQSDSGRGVWGRVVAEHERGIGVVGGNTKIKNRRTLMQMGGDVYSQVIGEKGSVSVGVMAGYGETRTHSNALLQSSNSQFKTGKARGKTHGYSVGVYGTVFSDEATRLGAYGDAWLQYGRYKNKLSSAVGKDSYNSSIWSASLEGGYAWLPFAEQSRAASVVVEPNAQLVVHHYHADRTHFDAATIRHGKKVSVMSRVGVRVYPQWRVDSEQAQSVRPFAEVNWQHRYGQAATVQFNNNRFSAEVARDTYHLNLGVEGRANEALSVSAEAFGALGKHSYRNVGGMVNVRYQW